MLRFDDVKLSYTVAGEAPPVRAVDGVSFAVGAGELCALYGESGSGKSTIMRLAAGLMCPDRGRVLFDGRELVRLSEREASDCRRFELGFVMQSAGETIWPAASVLDNAALRLLGTMRARDAHARVRPLLELLGLGPRLSHDGWQLSIGECQRILLCRALAGEPKLLVADEPTSSLDSNRSREVFELLRRLCRERGLAVLLATHDPLGTEYADRVYRLADGRLADDEPRRAQPVGR
jgi:putative ABC transport system ATP-binding protein